MKPKALEGVYVAAVTPRRRSGDEIDMAAALEIIDFLCARQVDGLALMGTTGEFIHFGIEDRTRYAALAVKRSRVPVLINVTHTTLDGTVRLAQEATHAGAAGLLVMPPPFFPYRGPELEHYYKMFAREVGSTVPLLLYNLPRVTSELPLNCALRLLASNRFVGIKDSSGDPRYLQGLQALRSRHPFRLMVGSDGLFTQTRMTGAEGIVSGVASAVPELLVALDRAITGNHPEQRDRLQVRLQEFLYWLERFPMPIGIREAAALRGLKMGPHAIPLRRAALQEVEEFRTWFRAWLPPLLQECQGA